MLLRHRSAYSIEEEAQHTSGLVCRGIFAIRPRGMIDRILGNAEDRAITSNVLWSGIPAAAVNRINLNQACTAKAGRPAHRTKSCHSSE